MISRLENCQVSNLDHLAGFIEVCPDVLDIAFSESHRHCGQGFALPERPVSLRSFALSHLDGIISRDGPIHTEPSRPTNPVNTTGLVIPSPLGVEHAFMNSVVPMTGGRFRASSECSSHESGAQYSFWAKDEAVIDVMIGIQARFVRLNDANPWVAHVTAYLLGGTYDRKTHIFSSLDTRVLIQSSYGADGFRGVAPEPVGPAPKLGRV